MKELTDSRTTRTAVEVSIIASLVLAGVAGAAPECEGLNLLIQGFSQAIEASVARDSCREALAVVQTSFEAGDWPRLQALVDALECRAEGELSAVAAQAERAGNKAAGTRVRKQMQRIKQAAQLVRNRILEIRSAD